MATGASPPSGGIPSHSKGDGLSLRSDGETSLFVTAFAVLGFALLAALVVSWYALRRWKGSRLKDGNELERPRNALATTPPSRASPHGYTVTTYSDHNAMPTNAAALELTTGTTASGHFCSPGAGRMKSQGVPPDSTSPCYAGIASTPTGGHLYLSPGSSPSHAGSEVPTSFYL